MKVITVTVSIYASDEALDNSRLKSLANIVAHRATKILRETRQIEYRSDSGEVHNIPDLS